MRTLETKLIWACIVFVLVVPAVAALGDWDEGNGHKMHWPQLPDLTPTGMDVQMYGLPLADDFKCSQTGPITDIHIWGSFMDDRLPPEGPGSLTFNVAIYSDIPQQGGEWSRPGEMLWADVFWPGEYMVRPVHDGPEDWYDPVTGEWIPANHMQAFQYNFHIEKEPYVQQEGRVYWLWIRESRVVVPGQPQDYVFGWKTSMVDLRWNDDAVFWVDDPIRPPLVPGWNPLTYPQRHQYELTTLDLAFVINGEGQPTVCEPTPDGKACVPYLCPDTTMTCLPTKIRVDYNFDPPEYTILNCECLRSDDCHVAIDPPDSVYCTGGCPNAGEKCRLQITENADGTVDYECVCEEPEPKHDLGDAPDSTNTHGFNMTAYPSGGPAGVQARYPTVFVANSPPHGPLHLQPEAVAWLGDAVTLENEADIGPDQDGVNNLDPPADQPDLDQADDGVQVPLVLPYCKQTTFDYTVTVAPLPLEPPTLYVNVWFDWSRDGDWNDSMQCTGATAPIPVPEWAVQNQVLNLVTSGPHTITTPQFMCWHPQPGADPPPIWMRITLSEQQWPPVPGTIPAGGEGPPQGYDIGETEDYYFTPEPPPPPKLEFGDAPEGALAYPSTCKMGAFPTCVTIGPAGWIQHTNFGAFFGPKVDFEPDGNAGLCPLFNPNSYDKDECFQDGDAGLLMPPSYTITGPVGSEVVTPCTSQTGSLGVVCTTAVWGNNVDIDVTNKMPNDTVGYVNVLMDWDKSGSWGGASPCGQCSGGATAQAPEHVLVDFPVPNGHTGPLSALNPPNFLIGPNPGHVWTRFTITEKKLGKGWTGEGSFEDGESEDYLLEVTRAPKPHDCDWVEGDDHKMHWPQLPDLAPTGMDVDMYWTSLADDFKCSENGFVTDIHFWGSFADDCLPPGGPDSVFLRLTFYSDVPAGVDQPFSHPGEPLWTRDFAPCQYTVRQVADDREEGWFDPATGFYAPANHFKAYQYNICIDPDEEPFEQKEGRIYWLEIQHMHGDVDPEYTFGWKTTPFDLHFNDDAVYFNPDMGWLPLTYPKGHELEGETLDLAFVITGEGIPQPDLDYGDAPDPTYPTLVASNGASHVIVPRIFLGAGVDPEPDGQPDVNAVGDDNDIDPLNPPPNFDDEDGVVFNSPLIPGQQATFTVTANAGGAYLQVWIDYNGDGSWAQASDLVFQDKLLQQGANVLPFQVPLSATPNIKTYARFRYSTTAGLSYSGGASDGEVEDYVVKIEEPYEPKPPVKHVKWSQPPVERQLPIINRVPVYCGWDEPASSSKELAAEPAWWMMAADDFRCLGTMPITSVHWWGSYTGWVERVPPSPRAQSWVIAFWSNVPEDAAGNFSRPGKLLWQVKVPRERVEEVWVGYDTFPDRPTDACFQYYVQFEPEEYFWQNRYIESAVADTVFWISITAVHRGFPGPEFLWGWKTRPAHWMDDAVTFQLNQDELKIGQTVDPATVTSIEAVLPCGQVDSYDLAFELDTDPNYIKWEQPFTGLRHWYHYEDEKSIGIEQQILTKWLQSPDLSPMGVDVDMYWVPLADDFKCTESGPITDITMWGSFAEDKLPPDGVGSLTFQIKIYSDIPQDGDQWSRPGKVLWGPRVFNPGEYTVQRVFDGPEDWYDPATGFYHKANHQQAYRYDFHIDREPFEQQEGRIYWLEVKDLPHPPPDPGRDYTFGWKTTTPDQRWNDDAVFDYWQPMPVPPIVPGWNPLKYPQGHEYQFTTLDLAFQIGTPHEEIIIHRLVADDWECRGHTPVTAAVWWGSYIGYRYDACKCPQMLKPRKPDYFLLTVWTDVPATAGDPASFSHPGQKIWEYRAYDYDEVLVGYDKHPEPPPGQRVGQEPVFRYSVRLPQKAWFRQKKAEDIYWFSVVAVYKDPDSIVYPWGWTNHRHVFNDDAVAGSIDASGAATEWTWEEIYDQTGISVDMSFMLFTEPGCFPSSYTTYFDWLALGKPNCWCGIYGNPQWPYQCDGDADNAYETGFKYQVYTLDLQALINNWKKKIGDPALNPCADFDHKSETGFKYRVYTLDLQKLIDNWKKKPSGLPGNCPRPE